MYNWGYYKINGYDVIDCFKWGFFIVEYFVYKWFIILIGFFEVLVVDGEGIIN